LPQLGEAERYGFGWAVALMCVLASARFAFAFLRHNARMFTVMALFTCEWMCVLGGYSAPEERKLADLITDIASFIEIYIGGLLLLETRRRDSDHPLDTSWLQTGGLAILLFIALPRQFDFPAPAARLLGTAGLTVYQAKLSASLAMAAIGSFSVGLGARGVATRKAYAVLVGILGLYVLLEAARTYDIWLVAEDDHKPMSVAFIYGFGLAKISYTASLGWIVATHGMVAEMRERGPGYWVRRFLLMAPDLPPHRHSAEPAAAQAAAPGA
jgi:hypothetical protein